MNHPDQKKILVIGTGALGGFFGAKLCKAGFDVHFLLRSDYDHVKKHGIKVKSRSGNIILDKVNCYNNPEDMPRGDLILIATKAFSNNELKHIVSPVLKDSGNVVLLQNGLGGEDYLADFIEHTHIFGGLCILAASKDGPGLINHHDFGSVTLGQYNPDGLPREISKDLEQIVEVFEKAGIQATADTDLMLARWKKLAWNIPFCGLSVVLDADTKQIISNPNSLFLAGEIIKDVAKSAAACGKVISPEFQQKMIDITIDMSPYFPSMKQDYDAGKPMEIEEIFGNPLRMAQKSGYEAKCISMIYNELKFIDCERTIGSNLNKSLK